MLLLSCEELVAVLGECSDRGASMWRRLIALVATLDDRADELRAFDGGRCCASAVAAGTCAPGMPVGCRRGRGPTPSCCADSGAELETDGADRQARMIRLNMSA